MFHPFDGVDEKLRRAQRHISELRQSVEQFLEEPPNRFIADFDSPQEGEFRRFHESRQVPLAISVLAGEALYQLRSTLDHVAAVFVRKHGGTLTRQTQFPIIEPRPHHAETTRTL